ncbi:hypothetical protein N8993_11595 [Pseudomonadales bacterium]|nr:hypothetical protein [Pseudomonadales bacterium]MDB2543102.1 hypothetical protein [Pseudomonadales bacterium]
MHPRFQREGIGEEMISAFLKRVSAKPDVRRVIVKTDDVAGAGRLYGRSSSGTHCSVYVATVNLA